MAKPKKAERVRKASQNATAGPKPAAPKVEAPKPAAPLAVAPKPETPKPETPVASKPETAVVAPVPDRYTELCRKAREDAAARSAAAAAELAKPETPAVPPPVAPKPAAAPKPETPKPAAVESKPYHCPICGKGSDNRQGVVSHLRQVHGLDKPARDAAMGTLPKPAAGPKPAPKPAGPKPAASILPKAAAWLATPQEAPDAC